MHPQIGEVVMDCINRREVKISDIHWSDNDKSIIFYFVKVGTVGYYLLDSQMKPLSSCDTCKNRLQCLIDEGIGEIKHNIGRQEWDLK